jgi:energy-coupling factor transporter transmembrane protein EcfT
VLLEKALLTVRRAGHFIRNDAFSRAARATPARACAAHLYTTVMLCFRYLSPFGGGSRQHGARLSSAFGQAKGLEMKHVGAFVGQLLLRSIDRAERVYAAMRARV